MKYLKNLGRGLSIFFQWLMLSSKDSTKIANTVKGSAVFIVLSTVAGLMQINGFDDVANSSIDFLVVLGQAISAGVTLFSFFQKLRRTALGNNAVLNDPML